MSNLHDTVISQFQAALSMMEQTIERCPADRWDDDGQENPFWRIAYHALFYVHLYLQPSEEAFQPWEHGKEGYQFLGPTPWPPHEKPVADTPYHKEELQAYVSFCRAELEHQLPVADLSAPSGFHWLPMDKLELQLYSIRHLQQHIGELSGHLLTAAGVEVDWVGQGRRDA